MLAVRALRVHGREEEEAGGLLRILDERQLRRHDGAALVPRGLGGGAAARLRSHVEGDRGAVALHGLDVLDRKHLGRPDHGPYREAEAFLAQLRLERGNLRPVQARDVAEAADARIAPLDAEAGHVVAPLLPPEAGLDGEEGRSRPQDLLVGGHALAHRVRDLVHGAREALLAAPLEAIARELRPAQGQHERDHEGGQGEGTRPRVVGGAGRGRGDGGVQRAPQRDLRALALRDRAPQLGHRPAHFDLGDRLLAEVAQRGALLGGERPRHVIDDAERAQDMAVRGAQRRARVEADVGPADHVRVVREARVRLRVRDLQEIGLEDGVGGEGLVARGLRLGQADPGLEPLPVRVQEAHERDGRSADGGRDPREGVEIGFGRGVEDLGVPQRLEPFALAVGPARGFHRRR